MAFGEKNFIDLVKMAVQNKASDIHIKTGEAPCLRIRGELVAIQTRAFLAEDVESIAAIVLKKSGGHESKKAALQDSDGGFTLPGLCRLRYNLFSTNGQMAAIFRIISLQIPTLGQLAFPKVLQDICLQKSGLVLVTGATGSGKSTTLTAMMDYINQNRRAHIITIEDPVEFLHKPNKARFSQREIGLDTPDFQTALRSALRQDPDVILIGEMRDPETVHIALKAAETGHSVFSTMHTTDALTTLGRILSMFSAEEQQEVRKRLAVTFHSSISQKMLPTADDKGVAVAMEIMVTTPGVREVIEGFEPIGRLIEIIKENYGPGGNGSQSFEQHLMELYSNKVITRETAFEATPSQSDFVNQLELD